MFTQLEDTIKGIDNKLNDAKRDSEGANYKASRCLTEMFCVQNCLIGLFIFIIVNMLMTSAAIVYAIKARDEARVNLIHLEHIEMQLDELRSKK